MIDTATIDDVLTYIHHVIITISTAATVRPMQYHTGHTHTHTHLLPIVEAASGRGHYHGPTVDVAESLLTINR